MLLRASNHLLKWGSSCKNWCLVARWCSPCIEMTMVTAPKSLKLFKGPEAALKTSPINGPSGTPGIHYCDLKWESWKTGRIYICEGHTWWVQAATGDRLNGLLWEIHCFQWGRPCSNFSQRLWSSIVRASSGEKAAHHILWAGNGGDLHYSSLTEWTNDFGHSRSLGGVSVAIRPARLPQASFTWMINLWMSLKGKAWNFIEGSQLWMGFDKGNI
jgi:hypothetical protein